MNSPGVFADLAAQRACWHPVAFAGEVADRPAHADLLGEPLVVWRGADGTPRVMSDLYVHRGTALSLGRIQGDELVCAYHGWRYAADGRCMAIPQKEDPAAVPAKARVRAFRVQERYGLIWVTLEEHERGGGQRGMLYFFASQPVTADRCAGYVVIGRNYNTDQPDRVVSDFAI